MDKELQDWSSIVPNYQKTDEDRPISKPTDWYSCKIQNLPVEQVEFEKQQPVHKLN